MDSQERPAVPQATSKPPLRRLILLRHAKSAWPEGVADHERPLAKRGEKAALTMGAYMAREGLIPDLVLVSTAKRTQQTWKLVRKALPENIEEHDRPDLYEAGGEKIVDVVRSVDQPAQSLMLIAHHPGMVDAVQLMTGGGDPDAIARITEKYPTAGLAVVAFDIERWHDVGPLEGYLERFVTPSMLE